MSLSIFPKILREFWYDSTIWEIFRDTLLLLSYNPDLYPAKFKLNILNLSFTHNMIHLVSVHFLKYKFKSSMSDKLTVEFAMN